MNCCLNDSFSNVSPTEKTVRDRTIGCDSSSYAGKLAGSPHGLIIIPLAFNKFSIYLPCLVYRACLDVRKHDQQYAISRFNAPTI